MHLEQLHRHALRATGLHLKHFLTQLAHAAYGFGAVLTAACKEKEQQKFDADIQQLEFSAEAFFKWQNTYTAANMESVTARGLDYPGF